MAPSFLPTLAVTALGAASVVVDAHQMMIFPEPFFLVDGKDAQWKPLAFLENQGVNTSADVAGFMKQKGYANLRALMDDEKLYEVNTDALFECGYTDPTYESQPIPTTGTIRSTGYTHDGPCEVWLDDVKVMSGDNCHDKFPGKTFPLDYSSCKGSCTLRWYWLGVRYLKKRYSWQIYKECVSLSDNASGSASASTPATTTKVPVKATKTPAPTTETPAPTSADPVSSGSVGQEGSYDGGEGSNDAPAAASTIPPTIPKCSVKKSRN
uniref:Uncharacterized protein n=1 Tax=Globisporangium ultimum (strain ATCC 200006 / CBS 805.95 / DAOM BR144) TaxID=431595 RepID=K3W9U9_GLOUD